MKRKVKLLIPAAFAACILLFAFNARFAGSIKGKVSPADAATRIWAQSATDTAHADIMNGNFEIPNLKAGTYKVVVDAKPPYQNMSKDNVVVADGQATDVGTITLNR